jgi:ubiquinone/menaquinone biosynthesis C-methylase UbiE
VSVRDAWEEEAANWLAWARTPGHDSYWRFHRDRFLALLSPPPTRLLDVGCGEGRLPRDLKSAGYEVVGIDGSSTLVQHALAADPGGDYRVADAAALPFEDGTFPLVTAFMSLHDIDDAAGALAEMARVLQPGGSLCMAMVHPINSAGAFEDDEADAPFVIRDSYFEERRYADSVERDGLPMTFTSYHRPLQAYTAWLEAAGMTIRQIVEVEDSTAPAGSRWQRIPLFIHLRATKDAG